MLRSFLKFLLTFTLVFLLCEGAARQFIALSHLPQGSSILLDSKFHLARQPYDTDKPTMLLLGDSYMNMAIYPELLAHRLGQSGLRPEIRNLANPGNNARMSLFFLKQAMAKGAHPKLVLLNLNPALFNPDQVWESETLFRRSYLGQCFYQPPTDWMGQLDCTLQKVSFLFRYRGVLKEQTSRFFTTISKADKLLRANPWGNKPHVYADISPGGWAPGYRIGAPPPAPKAASTPQPGLKPGERAEAGSDIESALPSPSPSRWDSEALRELQTYCQARNIPLVLVWFPDTQSEQGQPDSDHLAEKFAALAHEPHTRLINLRATRLGAESYYDDGHVNVLGALRLTEKLAGILKSEPYAPLLKAETQTVDQP